MQVYTQERLFQEKKNKENKSTILNKE